jgi:hypothetical protein
LGNVPETGDYGAAYDMNASVIGKSNTALAVREYAEHEEDLHPIPKNSKEQEKEGRCLQLVEFAQEETRRS